MKNILTLLCILLTVNVYAEPSKYAVVLDSYKMPVGRENDTLIKKGELAFYTIYTVQCDKPQLQINNKRFDTKIEPGKIILKHYMFSNTNPACFLMTVTDTDGRESRSSELFKAYDFRTPKTTECLP